MGTKIYSLAFMAVLISFLGFVLENTWLAFTKGYVDNRNMSLPFLFGYGIAVTAIYIFFGVPDNFELPFMPNILKSQAAKKILYFVLIFFCVGIGEILVGLSTEKLFGFFYWNYENIPLHITRYTSVPTTAGFSLIITFFTDNCFVPLLAAVEKIPAVFLKFISITMITLLTVDFVRSFYVMHKTHKPNLRKIYYIRKRGHINAMQGGTECEN